MKTLTRLATAAVTTVLVATVAGPAVGAPTADHPRVVQVARHVPEAPRGADPGVAYVDTDANVIRSGDREAALLGGEYPPDMTRAAGPGRWVFSGPDGGLYVAEVGEQPRLIAPRRGAGFQVDGPAHTRMASLERHRGTTRVVVRRLSDGDVVATRRYHGYASLLAFKQGKVWFTQGPRVAVWDVDADRVRLRAPLRSYGTTALDVGAGGAVHQTQRYDEVYPLRKDATWKPWRTDAYRIPLAWSPDGRYLAFGRAGNDIGSLSSISIFDATSGRLVRTFVAGEKHPFRPQSVRWETPTALLVRVDTTSYWSGLVRLFAGGRFERASELGSIRLSPVFPPTSVTIET